jgi:hypothetical protein
LFAQLKGIEMGTNYYVEAEPSCQTCGRGYEQIHIGKSSAGWVFHLHVYPEDGIHDLADWQQRWKGKTIRDEYGRKVSETEMLDVITKRGREPKWSEPPYGYKSWSQFHAENDSVPGPEGLLRARIDGRRTIGHGEGTWDLAVGDFS